MERLLLACFVAILLLRCSTGYIWRGVSQEPDCPDVRCENGGELLVVTCTCLCPDDFTGTFCEIERQASVWPRGHYSLLSPVFGCPEPENYGWYPGYVNFSKPETSDIHMWKMPMNMTDATVQITFDPHMLGPYYYHSVQINFCTRIDVVAADSWPAGTYCIFKAGGSCPSSFSESSVTLHGYTASYSETGGVLPDVTIDNTTVTLGYCCRDDAPGSAYDMALPSDYPFILFKVNGNECPIVKDMEPSEERFDFIEGEPLWETAGSLSMFTVNYTTQRLGMCYYAPITRRECYYEEDDGSSYNGRQNLTAAGDPCLPWLEANPGIAIGIKEYMGEFEENFCRTFEPRDLPRCYTNIDGVMEFVPCDIPKCQIDETLEKVGANKPVYAVVNFREHVTKHAVDSVRFGNMYIADRPTKKPWIQLDLEEYFEVHQVHVYKSIDWFPVNVRFVSVHVSKLQWDFFNYGSLQCEERRNPRAATKFHFVCYRPIVGQYMTIRNFDDSNPLSTWGLWHFFEVSEIEIYGKPTGCGRRLGLVSGSIRDFQLQGSSEDVEYLYDYGRLFRPGVGWCVGPLGRSSDDPYYMVDLIVPTVVQGFEVQGWVENKEEMLPLAMSLEYGVDENNLTTYQELDGIDKIFRVDPSQAAIMVRRFLLANEIVTTFVKINILEFLTKPCLKLELIGCPKRVSRDLACSTNSSSTVYGYEVINTTSFWMDHLDSLERTDEECRNGCLEKDCLMFIVKSLGICSYATTTRYNPHFIHWFVQPLYGNSVHTKLCVTDVSKLDDFQTPIYKPTLLQSPSYPFNYGQLIEYVWHISFESYPAYINLYLIDLHMIEPDTEPALKLADVQDVHPSSCVDTLTVDTLDITSENQAMYRDAEIRSRGSVITLTLTACASYSRADYIGFSINVTAADLPGCGSSSAVCNVKCSAPTAVIMNPGFPAGYSNIRTCSWQIQGNPGQFVQIYFEELDMYLVDSPGVCDGNNVALYDVSLDEGRHLIQTYCSWNKPIDPIQSSWHAMDVELFVSQSATTGGIGFKAVYQLIDYVQDIEENTEPGCPDQWARYGMQCYNWFQQKNTSLVWAAADDKCGEHGGHLVSIQTMEEMLFVHYLVTQKWTGRFGTVLNDIYIGLQKIGDNGRFEDYMWSDGSPLTFTSWFGGNSVSLVGAPPQPDGHANERCTTLKLTSIHLTQNWHDVACAYDKISQYICEVTLDNSIKYINEYSVPNDNPSDVTEAITSACTSGELVLNVYKCDGVPDCVDGSDETDCPETSCPVNSHRCGDGACVSVSLWCDFRSDCDDGSDETDCVYPVCSASEWLNGDELITEWRCDSGQCISSSERCDIKTDCYDLSDEIGCGTCNKSVAFQCYDQRCVAITRVCDGYVDCPGQFNEDEQSTCAAIMRFNCADWMVMGFAEDGQYIIDLGTDSGFIVECRFIKYDNGTRIAETIVHHQQESQVIVNAVTGGGLLRVIPEYSGTVAQREILLSRGVCRQHLAVGCSYDNHPAFWLGKNGSVVGVHDKTSDCACPYVEKCYPNRRNCFCDNPQETGKFNTTWYSTGHHEWLKDEGYITNHDLLPLQSVETSISVPFGGAFENKIRAILGPLICAEVVPEDGSTDQLICTNNDLVMSDSRCILDFNTYGEVTGCRDLSHMVTCGVFECPPGHIKCHTGYCIPLRLVCDGIMHCSLGEDEANCDSNRTCAGMYRCHDSPVCLPLNQVCNGQPDCPQRDDERLCHSRCPDGCTCDALAVQCSEIANSANYTELFKEIRASRKLNISGNSINVLGMDFGLLPYLIDLDISECGIESLGRFLFMDLSNLLRLDIGHNAIDVLLQNTFAGLGYLTELSLTGNPLRQIDVGTFLGLASLPKLDLSGSKISTIIRDTFIGLDRLEVLNINSSAIYYVEERAFTQLKLLESLDLSGNAISDFGKDIFEGLDSLQYLFSNTFTLCCVRPVSVSESNCWPPKDEFSSCDDLMREKVLRAFLWIIGITALLGNVFVLGIRFSLDREGLTKTHGLFVTNLSIADFLMGVYLIIVAVADTAFRGSYVWNDHQWRTGPTCQLAGVLSTLGNEGSVVFLCLITIDTLLVVKFPFGNVRISRNMAAGICVVVWVIFIALSIVPLMPIDYFNGEFYSRSAVCLPLPLTRDRPAGWEYSVGIFIVFNFIAFVLVATAQLVIYKSIASTSQKVKSNKRRHDMAIARKLFIIVVTDFLCWFPVGLMGMLALNGHVISGGVYAWIAVFVLPINSALNPFLYTIGSSLASKIAAKFEGKRKSVKDTTSFTSKDVFENDVFVFRQRRIRMKESVSTLVSAARLPIKKALAIALRVATSVDLLHDSHMVHGSLTPGDVIIKSCNEVITGIAVRCSPKIGLEEIEFANDVDDFGALLKVVLKAIQISK